MCMIYMYANVVTYECSHFSTRCKARNSLNLSCIVCLALNGWDHGVEVAVQWWSNNEGFNKYVCLGTSTNSLGDPLHCLPNEAGAVRCASLCALLLYTETQSWSFRTHLPLYIFKCDADENDKNVQGWTGRHHQSDFIHAQFQICWTQAQGKEL